MTGASPGFGRALAEAVLIRGDSAILTARRLESLQEIAAAHGERALTHKLDVAEAPSTLSCAVLPQMRVRKSGHIRHADSHQWRTRRVPVH
ncbi:hypothetical protein K8353_10955 [Burkholderia contaminans]|nr:hypothetical protein [Burkholderia contaminans]